MLPRALCLRLTQIIGRQRGGVRGSGTAIAAGQLRCLASGSRKGQSFSQKFFGNNDIVHTAMGERLYLAGIYIACDILCFIFLGK